MTTKSLSYLTLRGFCKIQLCFKYLIFVSLILKTFFFCFLFFFLFFKILFYSYTLNIVLVLPNIQMNPPHVYNISKEGR